MQLLMFDVHDLRRLNAAVSFQRAIASLASRVPGRHIVPLLQGCQILLALEAIARSRSRELTVGGSMGYAVQ
jgi:hypothetical protein